MRTFLREGQPCTPCHDSLFDSTSGTTAAQGQQQGRQRQHQSVSEGSAGWSFGLIHCWYKATMVFCVEASFGVLRGNFCQGQAPP